MRRPARAKVAAYGTWRALQQTVRAGTLALVRVICLLVVTGAAVGALEAARIYMAPAVLAVTGVSSYLFASYASSPRRPLAQLLGFADRTMIRLTALVLLGGLIGVLAMPLLASMLTGGEYDLSRLAVAGWALVAAATAGVTPYGQLASVRGRHVAVFWLRMADSVASLITIYVVVSATGDVAWAPLVMAAWSLAGGLAIRLLVIRPDVRVRTDRLDPTDPLDDPPESPHRSHPRHAWRARRLWRLRDRRRERRPLPARPGLAGDRLLPAPGRVRSPTDTWEGFERVPSRSPGTAGSARPTSISSRSGTRSSTAMSA